MFSLWSSRSAWSVASPARRWSSWQGFSKRALHIHKATFSCCTLLGRLPVSAKLGCATALAAVHKDNLTNQSAPRKKRLQSTESESLRGLRIASSQQEDSGLARVRARALLSASVVTASADLAGTGPIQAIEVLKLQGPPVSGQSGSGKRADSQHRPTAAGCRRPHLHHRVGACMRQCAWN